ncbi:hypothetical protein ACTOB_004619 [Actinoplanes oblitus]|uniref:Uncharacterized protein n=1 Tax=Actinoplanes oblitus TaxID=3040509 RepID=A0ABY8W4A7_9ACTN|nr:hypothetical protein [Actinoplanes oblitus]WIM92666.1 hypothetical protein ACTOB_004619 [Actinoplanes oblitus]
MDELDAAIVAHLHGFLMDKFSGRREIIGFRSSVIYEHARKPVIEALDP